MMTGLSILFLLFSSVLHEFHVSKCQIDYAENKQELQVTLHIFLDDFELALDPDQALNLNLCTEYETAQADSLVKAYLQENLTVWIDGEAVDLAYLGKEPAEDLDGGWFYLMAQGVPAFEEVTVSYPLLTEVFDDEQNIVSIKGPKGKETFFLLEKDDHTKSANFGS